MTDGNGHDQELVELIRTIVQQELAAMGFKPKKIRKPPAYKIEFSNAGFQGITDEDMERWQAAFPGVAIPAEIRKAASWMVDNSATKKNLGRFLYAWFSRCQRYADGKTQ